MEHTTDALWLDFTSGRGVGEKGTKNGRRAVQRRNGPGSCKCHQTGHCSPLFLELRTTFTSCIFCEAANAKCNCLFLVAFPLDFCHDFELRHHPNTEASCSDSVFLSIYQKKAKKAARLKEQERAQKQAEFQKQLEQMQEDIIKVWFMMLQALPDINGENLTEKVAVR